MPRIEERYYHSDAPFTVHVQHDFPIQQEVKFSSFDMDDEYAWPQVLYSGDTVRTDPEGVPYEQEGGAA